MSKYKNIETACVRSGYEAKNGESNLPPIVQSTTFSYDKTSDIADLFDLKESGFFYTRLGNPTIDALEKKICDLDGGVCAVATGSGQAANLLAVLNIAKAGDNIVAVNNIYGGTYNLFNNILRDLGIATKFVSHNDLEELKNSIDKNTKLVFAETISNPKASVLDIKSYADIAHEHNIPLILDNTLATPALVRPIDYGCDIVTYSSSKYIDGHAAALGGLIVDSGNFDWKSGNFPRLTEPDQSYHGLIFTEQFKSAAYGARLRTVGLRDYGAVISPQNAFLTILGLDTLFLRMNQHSKNALKVAQFLENNERVESVSYSFLESSPSYPYAKKYLKGGSGVVSFEIKGGREEASKFIDSLKLITLAVHVSDVRSLALHPASSTHRQLSDEKLKEVGVSKNLIRLSIGIENADDLIEDISQALDKAVRI